MHTPPDRVRTGSVKLIGARGRDFILAVGVVVCALATSNEATAQTVISPEQLARYLAGTSGAVLDVRMPGDCSDSLLLKRRHVVIPFDSTQAAGDALRMAQEEFIERVQSHRTLAQAKAKQQPVLVLCCSGGRAEAAAKLLGQHGFHTAFVPGGLKHEAIPARILKQ